MRAPSLASLTRLLLIQCAAITSFSAPTRFCETHPAAAANETLRNLLLSELWPHSLLRSEGLGGKSILTTGKEAVLTHPDYNASINAYKKIVEDLMIGTSMHSHVHLIRPLLDLACKGKQTCVYVEIGAFQGASMMLALSYPFLSKSISITLPRMGGYYHLDKTLHANAACLNLSHASHHLVFKRSQTALEDVKHLLAGERIDVLFVDGDHSMQAVESDFYHFSPLVQPGGIVMFDDFGDALASPQVKHGVDKITLGKNVCSHQWSCIGALPNIAQASSTCGYKKNPMRLPFRLKCSGPSLTSNEYIMVKLKD